jgi:hypothetical protein
VAICKKRDELSLNYTKIYTKSNAKKSPEREFERSIERDLFEFDVLAIFVVLTAVPLSMGKVGAGGGGACSVAGLAHVMLYLSASSTKAAAMIASSVTFGSAPIGNPKLVKSRNVSSSGLINSNVQMALTLG